MVLFSLNLTTECKTPVSIFGIILDAFDWAYISFRNKGIRVNMMLVHLIANQKHQTVCPKFCLYSGGGGGGYVYCISFE